MALINSILADIGPFFESPFPPATDGGPIDIIVDNVTITLEPDQPVFYSGSIVAPLDLCVEYLKLRMNPDGSISVVKTEQKSLSPRNRVFRSFLSVNFYFMERSFKISILSHLWNEF